MRVALYARVSTTDQTVEPQLDALRSYAEARRLEVVASRDTTGQRGATFRAAGERLTTIRAGYSVREHSRRLARTKKFARRALST